MKEKTKEGECSKSEMFVMRECGRKSMWAEEQNQDGKKQGEVQLTRCHHKNTSQEDAEMNLKGSLLKEKIAEKQTRQKR